MITRSIISVLVWFCVKLSTVVERYCRHRMLPRGTRNVLALEGLIVDALLSSMLQMFSSVSITVFKEKNESKLLRLNTLYFKNLVPNFSQVLICYHS